MMKKMKKIKAIGYCRVSTKDQSHHGTSLIYQRKKIEECIEKMGWERIDILQDDETGTEIEIRESIKKILARIDEWDVLVIMKPDRLSRSFGDAENMFKRLFEPRHKNVWSVDMNINLTNHPEMRQFKSVIADMEVRNIRSRVNQGFETASEGGYWIGRPPFGYNTKSIGKSHKDRKILVPNEDAELANDFFMYASEGRTHNEIATITKIPRSTIISILKNPVYYGYRKLNRTITEKDENDLIIYSKRKTWWVKHEYTLFVKENYLNKCYERYDIENIIKGE
jgi:DNA invertase Pin-like site-specific DNA recombinase